jgi:methyl-accepting chemotaxis protein
VDAEFDEAATPAGLPAYAHVHRRYHSFFAAHARVQGYTDVYLISPDGTVVYSMRKDAPFTRDLRLEENADLSLAEVFRAAVQGEDSRVVTSGGFVPDAPDGDAIGGYFAMPVRSSFGTVEAILAVRIDAEIFRQILARRSGLGTSGSAYLAAQGGGRVFSGEAAPGMMGRVGEHQIGARAPLGFREWSYDIIARQDRDEVLSPARALREAMFWDGLSALALVSVIGLALARSMSVPLAQVREAMSRVAHRDFDGDIPGRTRRDEIGDIARQLDSFRASLVEAEAVEREMAFKGAAFEATSSALMLVDAHLIVLYANEPMVVLLNRHKLAFQRLVRDFRPEQLAGRSLADFFPAAGRIRSEIAGTAHVSKEIMVGQCYLQVDMGSVPGPEGYPVGFVLEWSDVTDDRVLRAIVDAIETRVPVAGLSADGRVVHMNDLFAGWAGGEMSAIKGLPWDQVVRIQQGSPCSTPPWSAGAARSPRAGEMAFDIAPCTGSAPAMRVNVRPVNDDAVHVRRFVLIGSESPVHAANGTVEAADEDFAPQSEVS